MDTIKTDSIKDRKSFLDNIMCEYYYDKNSVEDTLDFLSYMFSEYEKLIKKNVLNK